jgi:alkanesulfonate monooxygenase SsuD/methylene tetrahydromethanopterin reductase-like flavin-dependent oxidoreductase (luciferase family)
MKVGWTTVWGGSVQSFRQQLRYADSAGISAVGIGDSPTGWNELCVALTIAAYESEQMLLTPMVAVPHLRHPIVHARAMSSLAELTDGRVAFALGTGASGAVGSGTQPFTQSQMREYLQVMRALLGGQEPIWNGVTLPALREPRPVPLYYSAWGPRSLAVAGEVADGVIIKIGSSLSTVTDKIRIVREAARAAGRDPLSIDVWAYGYFSLADSRDVAMTNIAALLASSAMFDYRATHATAGVPADVLARLRRLQSGYDVSQHVEAGGPNARLAQDLGLLDFLARRTAIAGTTADVSAYFHELAKAGVSRYFALEPTNGDPGKLVDSLVACAAG